MEYLSPLQSWRRRERLQSRDAISARRQMTFAVLTEEEVLDIYQMAKSGRYSDEEIAKMFGVDRTNVNHIKHGRIWGHLTQKGNENG
jgi:hypothetical protein